MATTTHIEEKPRIIVPRASRGNEILAILLSSVWIAARALPHLRGFLSKRSLVELGRTKPDA